MSIFGGFFNGLWGQTGSGGIGLTTENSASYPSIPAQYINQALNGGFSNLAQLQAGNAQMQYTMQQAQNILNTIPDFRINGISYNTLDDFLDQLYPEDCPEKTFLKIKLEKTNESN